MGAKTRKLSQINDSLIEWQSVVVADGSTGLTAVAGRGYFINTTGGAITVTLPTSPKTGDIVQLKDYARTWGTNNVTISSTLLDGVTSSNIFSTSGQTVTLVYMDNTKGWSLVNEDTTTKLGPTFITATGGTITTSGDFKIHTFTGDGDFVVATVGNPLSGTTGSTVDYLVVAGGASGAGGSSGPSGGGGGGGAGGFRESKDSTLSSPHTASPLAATTGITVTATSYPITVGGGGAGNPSANSAGGAGNSSIFSTITSAGGGGGGYYLDSPSPSNNPGRNGGSGGGAAGGNPGAQGVGGTGNSPPVSPPQGNPGGNSITGVPGSNFSGAGGGGATSAGTGVPAASAGGPGGNGATTSISGSSTTYAGGGGGSGGSGLGGIPGGTGGPGGGGAGASNPPVLGGTGSANTGGGGGGSWPGQGSQNSAGGSGIVVIRYKFQ